MEKTFTIEQAEEELLKIKEAEQKDILLCEIEVKQILEKYNCFLGINENSPLNNIQIITLKQK